MSVTVRVSEVRAGTGPRIRFPLPVRSSYFQENSPMRSYVVPFTLVVTLAIICFLLMPAASFGQSLTSGDISGTITDPSGAAVPNATVTIKNEGTGGTLSTTTNDTGAYRFHLLNPGTYTVSASAQGMQGHGQQVVVAVGQGRTVDLIMQVAGATQTVEVTAQ